MMIELHEALARQLEEREDLGDFVNSILAAYLDGAFIRKSDIAGMVVLNNSYRKLTYQSVEAFDVVTREFKGVTIEGQKASEAIFIPSEKLHDLVQENQVLLVVKSKRSKGIRSVEEQMMFTKISKEEMA